MLVDSPVTESAVPLASMAMTFRTHVESAAASSFAIGSGGPKKQFASSAHEPELPPHSASLVQAAPLFVSAMQCLPGPAPWLQFSGPVPALGPSVTMDPPAGVTVRYVVVPSGMSEAATAAVPPPT